MGCIVWITMYSCDNVQLEIFKSEFLPAAIFADIATKPHRLSTQIHRHPDIDYKYITVTLAALKKIMMFLKNQIFFI